MLTLYQAEWCPYSAAVREALTELGLPFLAVPVPAEKADRDELRELAGTSEIPTLVVDGEVHQGTEAVFAYLRERQAADGALGYARGHRLQYRAHRGQRQEETTAQVLAEELPLEAAVPR